MKQKIITPFYQIMNQFRNLCRSELQQFDLSQNETFLLMFLLKLPEEDTAKRISDITGMSPSLISRVVDSLNKRGFIQLNRDETDRRIVHIHLDEHNAELMQALEELDLKYRECLLEGIEPEKSKIFMQVLNQILLNIHKKAREGED